MLPLHREGLTSYLSPLLGQYGIRNIDFVTTFIQAFNAKTLDVYASSISADDLELGLSDELLSVPTRLTVYKNGKYKIDIERPFIGSLFNLAFKKRRRFHRQGTPYRNFKKLFHLSLFSRYGTSTLGAMEQLYEKDRFYNFENDLFLKQNYAAVRNSLHRKR